MQFTFPFAPKAIPARLYLIILMAFAQPAFSQDVHRVFFIGNSYTYYNDLPKMLHDVARSTGDSIYYDSNTPGGYTFQQHLTNTTSTSKIAAGNWTEVVLQEQSQLPSFPISQVESDCFPYAKMLDSLIHLSSPCASTVFYMTWGRKNGDASNCSGWPVVCTYEGMDSLLRERYMTMTTDNHALVAPVSVARRYIRSHSPSIELYQSDESHPTVAGTYVAACTFYSVILRKNPLLITELAGLAAADADSIRKAVKLMVYDSLQQWKVGANDPVADFSYTLNGFGPSGTLTNLSTQADSFKITYGNGDSVLRFENTFSYETWGTYTLTLTAYRCGKQSSKSVVLHLTPNNIQEASGTTLQLFPNPSENILNTNAPVGSRYDIIDFTGKICLSGVCSNNGIISVISLASGSYLLQLQGTTERKLFLKY